MLKKEEFAQHAPQIMDWVSQYLQNIESYPVKSLVRPKEIYEKIPDVPPMMPESIESIIKDLNDIIIPGISHWQHPNFHAYFPGNSSVESIFAETIIAAIGAQCMIWETSPAAAELEQRVVEWMASALGLSDKFTGVIQDSASSATLVAIMCAREVVTEFQSKDNGVQNTLRVYCSEEAHSSIEKAVGIVGIGRNNLIRVPSDEQLRIQPEKLEQQIEQDIASGYVPCCVVAALGTTGTLATDPLETIANICKRFDIWLHVDAAYAGISLLLPEYRHMAKGIEKVDSVVTNPHKWMFTNFDCSLYFVKNPNVLIKTCEVLPEYLKTKTRGVVNDYRDWGIPLGRRFRALKLWFVIRSYGIRGLQDTIRKHIDLTRYFADEIVRGKRFELLGDPALNLCCFGLKPHDSWSEEQTNERNAALLHRLNQSGKLYLSHTKIRNRYALRMVIGQTYVEKQHVRKALDEILLHADDIVNNESDA